MHVSPLPSATDLLQTKIIDLKAQLAALEIEKNRLHSNTPQTELVTEGEMFKYALAQMPQSCDGLEQDAFEFWAHASGYSMEQHPLHYLFLNAKTAAARDGWKAGIAYCNSIVKEAYESAKTKV